MTIFKYQSSLSQDKMTGEVRLVVAVVRRESLYDVEKWRQFPVAKRAFPFSFPLCEKDSAVKSEKELKQEGNSLSDRPPQILFGQWLPN